MLSNTKILFSAREGGGGSRRRTVEITYIPDSWNLTKTNLVSPRFNRSAGLRLQRTTDRCSVLYRRRPRSTLSSWSCEANVAAISDFIGKPKASHDRNEASSRLKDEAIDLELGNSSSSTFAVGEEEMVRKRCESSSYLSSTDCECPPNRGRTRTKATKFDQVSCNSNKIIPSASSESRFSESGR